MGCERGAFKIVIVGNNPATSSDSTRGSVVLAGGSGQEA
jgi:hypothetical protein